MEGRRRRAFRVALISLAVLLAACNRQEAREEREAPKTVQTQLVAGARTVSAGAKFKVGVLFKIEKPWHIYWKYPGPAGLATRVTAKLPPGFEASPVEWPVPKLFKQPGGVPGYGYDDELLLIQEIKVPSSIEYGVPVALALEARWLACSDICVPGKAELHETLQIGSSTELQHQEVFGAWEKHLPRPAAEFAQVIEQRLAGSEAGPGTSRKSRIALEDSQALGDLFVIPAPPSGVKIDKIEVNPRGNASLLEVSYNRFSSQPPGPEGHLEIDALVGFTNVQGEKRVYETRLRLE